LVDLEFLDDWSTAGRERNIVLVRPDGEELFIQRGRVSARVGMKPEGFPSHLKLFPSRVQLVEKLTEYNRRFESLFIK